jgi:subtilisin
MLLLNLIHSGVMKTQILPRKKLTGRKLVLLSSAFKRDTLFKTARNSSITLAHFNDYNENPEQYVRAFAESDGMYFEALHVAVLNENKEEEILYLKKGIEGKEFLVTEPERYVYMIGQAGTMGDREHQKKRPVRARAKFSDDEQSSWGVKATRLLESPYSGRKINIAVLDTGLYRDHVDLKGRKITTRKFADEGTAGDADGHGSHCTGISCGYKDESGMRYGVAWQSNIFCGKVLNDQGEGTDSGILAGMEWAMKNKCSVISLSLGAPSEVGEPYSKTYENVARRAMKQGSLIVAAAGNESRRPGWVAPVGHPANCPSILAVGAIDSQMKIAGFSCGGLNGNGGQVDLVAPGVSVYSMINKQHKHEKWDGTSMATPFVSGIAGLYFEQNAGASPLEVWTLLTQNAKRLKLSSIDGGAGLVQAPID